MNTIIQENNPLILTITDNAVKRIKEIMKDNNGAAGLLVGIKKGGCAGMEYTIDFITDNLSNTDKIEKDGICIFIEREATLFLLGTEIDFETTPLRTGFIFKNPNQISTCGCGESVKIVPVSSNILENR